MPYRERPSRETPQLLANFVILVILWAKFDHVGVCSCDGAYVLSAILPGAAIRCRELGD